MKKLILGTGLFLALSSTLVASEFEYSFGHQNSANTLYGDDKQGMAIELNYLSKCKRRCNLQHSMGFEYSFLDSSEDNSVVKDSGNIFSLQYKFINRINHYVRPYLGVTYSFQDVGVLPDNVNQDYSSTAEGFGYKGGIKFYFNKNTGMEVSASNKIMHTSNSKQYDIKNRTIKLIYSF
jgi:hypothetical protein